MGGTRRTGGLRGEGEEVLWGWGGDETGDHKDACYQVVSDACCRAVKRCDAKLNHAQ